MKLLHPGARWVFRINTAVSFLIIYLFVVIFTDVFSLLSLTTIIVVITILIFAEIYARMAYGRWQYDLANEGLKIEKGIIWKRYSTIPYDRIQNVDVHRGIFARMLGFSTIMIQTAGYSGQSGAEGGLPAVDAAEAEKIRAFITKKIAGGRK